jgi:hypothetical protein
MATDADEFEPSYDDDEFEDHEPNDGRTPMVPHDLYTAFGENPEFLLALQLSTPIGEQPVPFSSVTVEFHETEVVAKVKQPRPATSGTRILASKQTIFAAILMHHLIQERGSEFAESLESRAAAFGHRAARINADFNPSLGNGWYPPGHSPDADSSSFFQELDIRPGDLETAQRKTNDALAFLEREGLAIDPAFTPELMILAGLIPMHFSVRTPKGERIHKEISVNAPLWSLDIVRGTRAERPYTDFEFKFRGIEIVRKALTAMASHYLESEETTRRTRGQPVLPRKGKPSLDPPNEA